MRETTTVDPITLAVIAGSFAATVDEMTVVIERTARAPIVAIGHDYSNAVYVTVGEDPEMVVQGEDQPCHLGGMISSVKNVARLYAGKLKPGDVIIGNHPALNGTHLPDVDLIQPIFHDGKPVAWACSRAHEIDIGGPVPGGYNPDAEELYAEGLVIPPVKLVEEGRDSDAVWQLILANVRSPEMVKGDIGAQLSAVRTASSRLTELLERYGGDVVIASARELLNRSERLMREEIRAMPDGLYSGECWIEEDGRGTPEVRFGCTIEVNGDQMKVKIESPPACKSYRNSYWGQTRGAVYFGVLSGIAPGIPINEGLYRAITLEAPPLGSMLNAAYPTACVMSTSDIWTNVFNATCDAMSQVVPHRACAGWDRMAGLEIAGIDPRDGQHYGGLLHIGTSGGAGAVYGQDGGGLWGVISTGGASTVGDIELLEFRLPLHFHRYQLLADSACPGRWRGAWGAEVEIEVVDHDAVAGHVGDGTKFPAPSRLGGGSAFDASKRVHRKYVIRSDGSHEPLLLHKSLPVAAGERVHAFLPGGGGVGKAHERDPELVRVDLMSGLLSAEGALADYGRAVDEDGIAIDWELTTRAREPGKPRANATVASSRNSKRGTSEVSQEDGLLAKLD